MTGIPLKPGQQDLSSIRPNLPTEVKSREPLATLPLRPQPDAELCDRLVAALEQAAIDRSLSMEALRLTVRDFTLALRQQGTTPEGVLISLKSVINHRRARPTLNQDFHDGPDPAIHEKISTWSIQEFFRDMVET